MSDLMIRWAEKLLIVLVAVALVTLVFSAIGVMFMSPRGGFVAGLMTLVVGALSIITESKEETTRVLSQVKRVIRTNYSNPPTHGAIISAAVLNDPTLRAMWEEELGEMRVRIQGMRKAMVERLADNPAGQDFSFVARQCGMFSYSGLTVEQVERLKEEFGIYAVGTGRICVAALNNGNLDSVTRAIHAVL